MLSCKLSSKDWRMCSFAVTPVSPPPSKPINTHAYLFLNFIFRPFKTVMETVLTLYYNNCLVMKIKQVIKQSCNRYAKVLIKIHQKFTNKKSLPAMPEGLIFKTRQRPTLPSRLQDSTIGAGKLNFRVRNGIGWCLSAMTTWISFLQHHNTKKSKAQILSAAAIK